MTSRSDAKSLECLECGKPAANTNNVLARHIRKAHGLEWPAYVVKHHHAGEWPRCACGCGEGLSWKKGGFGRYVKGHEDGDQASSARGRGSLDAFIGIASSLPGHGWVPNPFTGREEYVSSEDQLALLLQCARQNDPVTRDHSLRVPWETISGEVKLAVPDFKHLQERIILDAFSDDVGPRRMSGYRGWCDQHAYVLLALRRSGDAFDVVYGYDGRAKKDA